jgi:hypothetical protein
MVQLTDEEVKAMELFNRYKSDRVYIDKDDPVNCITPAIAAALNKKGQARVAVHQKEDGTYERGEFDAVLTIAGAGRCAKMLEEVEGPAEEPEVDLASLVDLDPEAEPAQEPATASTQEPAQEPPVAETKTEPAEKTEEDPQFVCMCGKKVKSKSGLTRHQNKCKVYQEKKAAGELEDPVALESAPEKKEEPKTEPTPEKKEEPVRADPVVEQPIAVPVVPQVPAPPPAPTMTEVAVGTNIVLNGKVWRMEAPTAGYVEVNVDNVVVKVVAKQPEKDNVWLTCQAENSTTYWAVYEENVLNGTYPVYVPEEEKSQQPDLEKFKKDQESFGKSLASYVGARDGKLKAEKFFKAVDKKERSSIENYIRTYGKESGTGMQDFQTTDFGHKSHLVRTPPSSITRYDEERMVEWLEANGHGDCVKKVPNIPMWDNLKEAGQVPPDVINELEDMEEVPEKFALRISVIKDEAK